VAIFAYFYATLTDLDLFDQPTKPTLGKVPG